jgi:hypothetical protein
VAFVSLDVLWDAFLATVGWVLAAFYALVLVFLVLAMALARTFVDRAADSGAAPAAGSAPDAQRTGAVTPLHAARPRRTRGAGVGRAIGSVVRADSTESARVQPWMPHPWRHK